MDEANRFNFFFQATIHGVGPAGQHDHGSVQHPSGVVRIHGLELTACHTFFEQADNVVAPWGDDFFVVKATQFWKIASLGNHQFGNSTQRCTSYMGPPLQKIFLQQFSNAAGVFQFSALEVFYQWQVGFIDNSFEQLFLVLIIQVQGTFADARTGGHFLQFCGGKTFFREHLYGGVKQLGRPGRLSAIPPFFRIQ